MIRLTQPTKPFRTSIQFKIRLDQATNPPKRSVATCKQHTKQATMLSINLQIYPFLVTSEPSRIRSHAASPTRPTPWDVPVRFHPSSHKWYLCDASGATFHARSGRPGGAGFWAGPDLHPGGPQSARVAAPSAAAVRPDKNTKGRAPAPPGPLARVASSYFVVRLRTFSIVPGSPAGGPGRRVRPRPEYQGASRPLPPHPPL